jgi:hypothetical protein
LDGLLDELVVRAVTQEGHFARAKASSFFDNLAKYLVSLLAMSAVSLFETTPLKPLFRPTNRRMQ